MTERNTALTTDHASEGRQLRNNTWRTDAGERKKAGLVKNSSSSLYPSAPSVAVATAPFLAKVLLTALNLHLFNIRNKKHRNPPRCQCWPFM